MHEFSNCMYVTYWPPTRPSCHERKYTWGNNRCIRWRNINERDRRCSAVQLTLSTDPTYDNRTIASTLKMQIRTVNAWGHSATHRTTLRRWWSGRPHHATSHLRSRLESQRQSVPGCDEECGDSLVQSGGRWLTLDVAAELGAKETQAWLQIECFDFVPFSHWPPPPWPEPAELLRLVMRREHHQHDLPQHQSQPDRYYPQSIRRAPAGACGKGMLPVPDPYRGGD